MLALVRGTFVIRKRSRGQYLPISDQSQRLTMRTMRACVCVLACAGIACLVVFDFVGNVRNRNSRYSHLDLVQKLRGENFRYFGHDCVKREASAGAENTTCPRLPLPRTRASRAFPRKKTKCSTSWRRRWAPTVKAQGFLPCTAGGLREPSVCTEGRTTLGIISKLWCVA